MSRIIIADSLASHANSIKAAISIGYGSDISADIEIYSDGWQNAWAVAVDAGAEAVIRSYTGVEFVTATAKYYYDEAGILTFYPLGSNAFVEMFNLDGIPEGIVVSGAGDEELRNNTGYGAGLEFWDWDLTQTEEPSPDQSSYSNGIVLGKLLKIKDEADCTWSEARYRARQTCPREEPNRVDSPWGKYNGYGRIDVTAAVALEMPVYTNTPTNYQTDIIDEIKARLEATGEFNLVGEYPETNTGTNYPLALVIDGDQDFEGFPGNRYSTNWNVGVFISAKVRIDRIAVMSNLQAAVISAVTAGNTLNGTANTVRLLNIEKGEYSPQLEDNDVGYNDQLNSRLINFEIGACTYEY